MSPKNVRSVIKKEIRDGRLKKLDGSVLCVDCNRPASVYDHRDYSKPSKVDPVCFVCNARRGPAKNRHLIGFIPVTLKRDVYERLLELKVEKEKELGIEISFNDVVNMILLGKIQINSQ